MGWGSLDLVKEGNSDRQQAEENGCVKHHRTSVATDTRTVSHSSFFSVSYLQSDMQHFEVRLDVI